MSENQFNGGDSGDNSVEGSPDKLEAVNRSIDASPDPPNRSEETTVPAVESLESRESPGAGVTAGESLEPSQPVEAPGRGGDLRGPGTLGRGPWADIRDGRGEVRGSVGEARGGSTESRGGPGDNRGSSAEVRGLAGESTVPPQPGASEFLVNDRELLLAVFSYVPVLCLVPIIVRQPSEFIAFHLRQGIALLIIELLAGMTAFVPIVGVYVAWMLALFCVSVSPIAFIRTGRGLKWEIPLVTRLAGTLSL